MERKSDMVRRLVAGGDFKRALGIAKDFRLGITKGESDAMKLAYECTVHGRFYQSIGYDLDEKVKDGLAVLKRLYGRSEEHDLHKQVLEPVAEDGRLHSGRGNTGSPEVCAQV